MQDSCASVATEHKSWRASTGTGAVHLTHGSCDVAHGAQPPRSTEHPVAVAAAQSVPVSQNASATDFPPPGCQSATGDISSSSSLNVQAVQRASCSDTEGRAAAEQVTTIRAFPGTAPSAAASSTARSAAAVANVANEPALHSSKQCGWTGLTQQASVTGTGNTAASTGRFPIKFNLGKLARSKAAKGQTARTSAFTQDIVKPSAIPTTAPVSCVQPKAARSAVSSHEASVPGNSLSDIAQQASGMPAALETSPSRPASAVQEAVAPAAAATADQGNAAAGQGNAAAGKGNATAEQGNEEAGLDALLGAIDELEGDSALGSSAAATLAATGSSHAADQAAASSSQQTGTAFIFCPALCC